MATPIHLRSSDRLSRLGFDATWQAIFDDGLDELVPGMPMFPARVSRTDRGACDTIAARGGVRATWGADVVAAVAQNPQAVPSTGDWVRLQRWPDGNHTIESVLTRRTSVVRAQARGTSQGQVLATNVDVVAVVEALFPDPDLARVERFLTLAWDSGAQPRLVLTKSDLEPHAAQLADEIGAEVAAGCPVDLIDARQGNGLDGLRTVLAGGATVALLGASGVGKSTLLNALVGASVMRTRDLGAVQKGRHTTVTRELHVVPAGGAVIDTPGLRGVGVQSGAGLADVFADVDELAQLCRFRDCRHDGEPGCAVQEAVDDGRLTRRRLASWRKLQREAAYQARRVDVRLRQAETAVYRQRALANRQLYRSRRRAR